jgi:Holliday junction resolvase
MTKGINSRQKGCRGEREWRDRLIAHGYEARRGQQFSGGPDSPDVVCSLPFHFEVKRVEKLNIEKAVTQSEGECGDKMPVVAHKKNRGQWLVTMPERVFFSLLKDKEKSI